MNAQKLVPIKRMHLLSLVVVIALFVAGCSGSSDSGSNQIVSDGQATVNDVDNSSGANELLVGSEMNPASMMPVDDTENESSEAPAVDPQSPPAISQPSPTTVRVDFDIMVPAYMSNELQVRLDWGDINTAATFIRDESWSVSENFPSNTENLLTITFFDRNGALIIGRFEETFRTGTDSTQTVQVSADQFNVATWDDDNDGVSNLDELIAGTNPTGDDAPMPVQAALELVPDKTFRITWQTIPNASFYQVLENPDGVSGFSDISGQLNASTSSFDHRVALYARVNAQYLVQSCNDQGCIDSEPVLVTGTLDNAIGYFKASNPEVENRFGDSVNLSADGSTLVVSSRGESSGAMGINGLQIDRSQPLSGAVYVFVRVNGLWQQQAYIKASNTEERDQFGSSISLSTDGNTLAVGALFEDSAAIGINGDETDNSAVSSGAAYVFVRQGDVWQQQAYLKASNAGEGDRFGAALSLSADGNTLTVGAPQEDSAATGINSDQNDDSQPRSGAVYVFVRSDSLWQQEAYLKASNANESDNFGTATTLSADGNTLVVGAPEEASAATGINGDQNDDSQPRSGAVYVFVRNTGLWQQQAYIKASNTEERDQFGNAVSLSADGNTLAVGATGEESTATGVNGEQFDADAFASGAVYVLIRNDGLWQQQAYVKASNTAVGDSFGAAVSLSADGSTLAVGADLEDGTATGINGDQSDNSQQSSGAVYVFVQSAGLWQQQSYVKASNTEDNLLFGGDRFGHAVSLSADGNTMAVGAVDEDGQATGFNGDQGNGTFTSGAVYLY